MEPWKGPGNQTPEKQGPVGRERKLLRGEMVSGKDQRGNGSAVMSQLLPKFIHLRHGGTPCLKSGSVFSTTESLKHKISHS
ncbi:unnamed protein product [Merluccius merluccius]